MNKRKKWIVTAVILVVFCAVLGVYRHFGPRLLRFGRRSGRGERAPEEERSERERTRRASAVPRRRHYDGRQPAAGRRGGPLVRDFGQDRRGSISRKGRFVRKGELLAKVNDKPLLAQLSRYERSSSWPRTGFTARARCSKRTPSVRRPTSRPVRSWRCSTPISTSSRPISR